MVHPDDARMVQVTLSVPDLAMLMRYAAIGSASVEMFRCELARHPRASDLENTVVAFIQHSHAADIREGARTGVNPSARWNSINNRMVALAQAADPTGDVRDEHTI